MTIALIDSGVANLASIGQALRSLGCSVLVTDDPARVAEASHIVLPGVGSFASGITTLRSKGLDKAILEAHASQTPLLGICLGMQLLGSGSQECEGMDGLGIIPEAFVRLPDSVSVPHLGWNGVVASETNSPVPSGTAAFANSFCLPTRPKGWHVAYTVHGIPFISAAQKGRTLALQFHPELSGHYGTNILRQWLKGAQVSDAESSTPASSAVRRIIPCLDTKDGRVVKGIQFQQLRDAGDPAELSEAYAAQGADEIVILDVGASPEGRSTQYDTIQQVRERVRIPIAAGGGLRKLDDARQLLKAGADKVTINTAAIKRPALVKDLADAFGSQCIVLAIDARRGQAGWDVLVNGGREAAGVKAVDWAQEAVTFGAGEILLTSWDRDGTRDGCDLELIEAVSNTVSVPVIASGGIGTFNHALDAVNAGADAILAASIFHDGEYTVRNVKDFLISNGCSIRQ